MKSQQNPNKSCWKLENHELSHSRYTPFFVKLLRQIMFVLDRHTSTKFRYQHKYRKYIHKMLATLSVFHHALNIFDLESLLNYVVN